MKIATINIKNFRQFKKAEITFSQDSEKPVSVIIADNNVGKTTLIRAFTWCMYRINDFVEDKILLNKEVADAMDLDETKTVKVIISLEHNDIDYKITTEETYIKTSSGVKVCKPASTEVIKIENSNAISLYSSAAQNEIREILPEDLKEYFFFDGESNKIEKISEKKNLRSSINILTKVEKYKNIADLVEGTISNFNKRKKTINDFETIDLRGEIENINVEIDTLKKENKDHEKKLDELERSRAELESELNSFSGISQKQKESKELQSDIEKTKNKILNDFDNLTNFFGKEENLLNVLFNKAYIEKDVESILSSTSFTKGNNLSFITEKAVDQLIARGRCLCGCEITNGNTAYHNLIKEKEHMEPNNYGKHVEEFENSIKISEYNRNKYVNNVIDEAFDITKKITDLETYKKNLKAINNEIIGMPDVGVIQKNYNTVLETIGRTKQSLDINYNEINRLKEEITKKENKITSLEKISDENKQLDNYINLAKNTHVQLKKHIDKKNKEIHAKLEEKTNEIFQNIYHGEREITISDDFKVEARLKNENKKNKTEISTGTKTVVNFSFVAGLIDIVKERILDEIVKSDEDDIDKDMKYPLVLDAPFSNCDEIHISNICKELPKHCEQIIIFVMAKDFNSAINEIRNKIGYSYELEKITETDVKVKIGDYNG